MTHTRFPCTADKESYAEDKAGHAIIVRVQFPLPRPSRSYPLHFLQELYPIGSCMIVQEPYVHFSPTAGVPEIDVGFSSDIVLLPGCDEVTSEFTYSVSDLTMLLY